MSKAKSKMNIFENYCKTDEMNAEEFLDFLEDIGLSFDSKETKVLLFYLKGWALYFKK